jgi:hypothetical protein
MLRVASVAVASLVMATSASSAVTAQPGTLSYLEGRAWSGSKPMTAVPPAQQPLWPGQIFKTEEGKAEVFLIPGTYLRLSQNTAFRMVSASLTNTQVELLSGQALVDVKDLRKENRIRISGRGASAMLLKNGLYRFDADEPKVSVFDGKAAVSQGDQTIELTKGHEAVLTTSGPVDQKFDRDQSKDDLYRWSKLRSEYLQAANMPRLALVNRGWYGRGWYYGDPWYGHGFGHGWSFGYGHGFSSHFRHH